MTHDEMDDRMTERSGRPLRFLPVGYGLLVSSFVFWLLWKVSQWLLGLWSAHPTWREQFGAYATLLIVLTVGFAGVMHLLGGPEPRGGRRDDL